MNKLLNLHRAACLVAALLAAPGCEREAGPSGVRKRPAASAAASASSTAAGESERETTGRREGGKDLGVERARPQAGLSPTTSEQLLAHIKSSGKKATLVNAWASWCGPCRREVPMLQALAANLKPQGVEVVLVSVDDPKDEAKAASFLEDNGITLKSYLVAENLGDFKLAINPRWPGMLPASFLFDAQGRLVHFWGGEAFEQEIVSVVDAFLAGRAIESETRFGLAPGKVE
jgi:thiol-disulfide isomerase/thioredoxin